MPLLYIGAFLYVLIIINIKEQQENNDQIPVPLFFVH